jgi:serine/threonine protein kinase
MLGVVLMRKRVESSQTFIVCRYERTDRLGEGTYGVVYRARDKLKNTMVALKKVRVVLFLRML